VNKTVSAIGGLFIILVAVVFIVQFRPAVGGAGSTSAGPACAVEIHGGCIPTTHYWAAYRLVGGGFDQQYLRSMGLRRLVTEGLIERFVLNEDAKRLGIHVSDEDVTRELALGRAYVSLPSDKERELGYYLGLLAAQPRKIEWEVPFRVLNVKSSKTKTFDLKTYEKTVRNITKMSPTDFREFQREEMTAARMRDLVRSRVHVAESEGYEEYSRQKATITVNYVKLNRNFYADLFVDANQKAVDDWASKNADEINKTYEARKAQYEGECRVAKHILAKASEDASQEAKDKAKKRIDAALAAVNKGEDFGEVAKRFSEDGSATKGGDLGCVPRKQTVEPFEKALFALDEGKVSPIVTTEFGYHIIKLEKIAKGDAMEKVLKAQIARDLYMKHEADTLAAEAAKSIQAAVKGGKSLDDALKTHLEELAAKQNKDKKGDKKAEPAKKDDKAKGDKKDEKAAADEVEENKPFTMDTHPDRPIVQASTPFNASGNPIPEAMSTTDLVKTAFQLQKPGDTTNDVISLHDGYAVVTLKEKTPVKKEDWEKDRDQTLTAIRKAKQAEALMQYIQRLRSKVEGEAPIKRNEAITNDPPEEKNEQPAEPEDPGEP
jgi:peptidyl-prolyl cis-trans isomerase D